MTYAKSQIANLVNDFVFTLSYVQRCTWDSK